MFLAHPQEARGSERKPHEYVKRRSGVKGYKNKSPHEKAGFLSIDKRPYAFKWGLRVLIRGGDGRLGQLTPPV